MNFGFGIDDLTGKVRGLATTRPKPEAIIGTGGQIVTFSFKQVVKTKELHSTLGLEVKASASYGLFSGSAKFNFAESCNFNSYSVFLIAKVTVVNQELHTVGEQLQDSAAQLLENGKQELFRERFGDLYVKGLQTGGEYFVIFEVLTESTSEQTDISAHIDAGALLASISSDFSSEFKRQTQNHRTRIFSYQVGGAGAGASVGVTIEEIIGKLKTFPVEALKNPVASKVELQDYNSLNLPSPPNRIDLEHGKDVLNRFASDRVILLQLQNDILYIKFNPEQFEPFDDSALTDLSNQIDDNLNQIADKASRCLENVKSCDFISLSIPSRKLLPKRKAGPDKPPVEEFVKMPDLKGLPYYVRNPSIAPDVPYVTNVIEMAGLVVGKSTVITNTGGIDKIFTVASQETPLGALVPKGTVINFAFFNGDNASRLKERVTDMDRSYLLTETRFVG